MMFVFIVSAALGLLSATALAQGRLNFNSGRSHYQPPGIGGASALSDGEEYTHADNFGFDARTTVETLAWWGIGFLPAVERFSVQLLADSGGGLPGAVLASLDVSPDIRSFGGNYRLYSTTLAEPWALEANTTYWLSIVGPPGNLGFGWYLGHEGDQHSALKQGQDPWQPIGWEMAFGLNFVPQEVPEARIGLLMSVGIAGLLWPRSRRLRSGAAVSGS